MRLRFLLGILVLSSTNLFAQNKFNPQLDWSSTDTKIIVGSGLVLGLDYLLFRDEITSGNRNFTSNSNNFVANEKLARYSDFTLYSGAALAFGVAISKKNERLTSVKLLGESLILTTASTMLLKHFFDRPRPYTFVGSNFNAIGDFESFPSGHSSIAFTTAVFTTLVLKNANYSRGLKFGLSVTAISLASATALLRIEAGKHFPSDVVFGTALGCVSALSIDKFKSLEHKRLKMGFTRDISTSNYLLTLKHNF